MRRHKAKQQNDEKLFSVNENDTEILKDKNRDCLDWGKRR